MIVSDCVPQSLPSSAKSKVVQSTSISSTNIPLVSSRPLLAVSPNYILLDEYTKRSKQWILLDEQLQRTAIPCPMKDPVLDAIWCQVEEKFFLLTTKKIYSFDPRTQTMEERTEFQWTDNRLLKCVAYSASPSTLWIAHDEWESSSIDQWRLDEENHCWQLVHHQPIDLTSNETVGSLTALTDKDDNQIAMSIFNCLTNEWRMEVHHAATWICLKAIRFPGSTLTHDYRMLPIQTPSCDVRWLAYSQVKNDIFAIDSKWKSISMGYRSPLQRIALFRENYLIVRTAESVDILLFS